MVTLNSTHARHPHLAVTEAALWAVWSTARWTGIAALIRAVGRVLRTVHPPRWIRQCGLSISRFVDRVILRAELETGAAFTAARETTRDHLSPRVRRRAPFLIVATLAASNLAWLYLAR